MSTGKNIRPFGDIAFFVSGSRPQGGVGQIKEGALSLGGEHVGVDGKLALSTPKYVPVNYYMANPKGHIKSGDILLCKDGALSGKVAIECGELSGLQSMVNEHVFIIRTDKLDQKYLFYYLFSPIGQRILKGIVTGAAQGGINGKNLKSIPVVFPDSIAEQKRIVEELDLLSSVIDKKNEQLRDLEALAQSIFYEMFGDPVANEKGWPVKHLNSVCDVRDGTHDSPKYLPQSDYILITSKNINGDTIDYSNINYISKEDYDAINRRSRVDEGDIIMAMIGTIGKPVIVHQEGYRFCVKNVALIKFPSSAEVTNVYIRALLNSPSYSAFIMSLNKGGTQKFVALGTLRSLPIPVPSSAALKDFSERIAFVEKQAKIIKQSIAELNTLRSNRMCQYFV